jgi:hypothetical protein
MYRGGKRIFSDIGNVFTGKISKSCFYQKTSSNRLFSTSLSDIKPFDTKSLAISSIFKDLLVDLRVNKSANSSKVNKLFIDLQMSKHKDFLSKYPYLFSYLEDYKNNNKIKIDKKIEDCNNDVKILKEIGIPLKDIYILYDVPKSNFFDNIGLVASNAIGITTMGYGILAVILSAQPLIILPIFVGNVIQFFILTGIGRSIDKIVYGVKPDFLPVKEHEITDK